MTSTRAWINFTVVSVQLSRTGAVQKLETLYKLTIIDKGISQYWVLFVGSVAAKQ